MDVYHDVKREVRSNLRPCIHGIRSDVRGSQQGTLDAEAEFAIRTERD